MGVLEPIPDNQKLGEHLPGHPWADMERQTTTPFHTYGQYRVSPNQNSINKK